MKITTRIILTVAILLFTALALKTYHIVYSPLTGAATAAQFDDSLASYEVAKVIREGGGENLIMGIGGLFAFILWLSPLIQLFRARTVTMVTALVLAFSLFYTSCQPYKVATYKDVKSNETAWAIPMDGSSQGGQIKFNSVEFLNQRKIAAKRIMIDKVKRDIGRMYWDIEWIDAVQVITVDRSLVTREWTSNKEGNKKAEGIDVVTQDSVGLEVGLTITASIDEDDASTYLYYHGARPLSQVLDENVRSFAVSELTREYSNRDLTKAQKDGEEIYQILFENAKKVFKAKGVTIQYLGNQGGLEYKDKKVQESINARYIAEQDAKTAFQEQEAQKIRNATRILNAQTEADQANKLAAAKEAVGFQTQLRIQTLQAEAQFEMAKKWNGAMPLNILPANSPMLMNLGEKK